MPYNSQAFERQLARYKNEQAAKKAVADGRGGGKAAEDRGSDDPHVARSKVKVGRATLQPNKIGIDGLSAESGRSAPVLREKTALPDPDFNPIIVKGGKKPFYRRGWFTFIFFSVVSTAAVPIFYKDEMKDLMGIASMVKTSTGVDPFALSTYTNMFKGKPPEKTDIEAAMGDDRPIDSGSTTTPSTAAEKQKATPVSRAATAAPKPAKQAEAPKKTTVMEAPMPTTTDMHEVVDMAAERAAEVTAQGATHSMQYIEDETKRLQEMAKQFDDQYGGTKK